MTSSGYVTSVWDEPLSTLLTADAAVGDEVLVVQDTGGFTLGDVSLDGQIVTVTAMDDTTLTLDPGTPVPPSGPYEATFPVYNCRRAGVIETERRADLAFNTGGTVDALVPTTVEGYLTPGDYDPPVDVEAELIKGEWQIQRLDGTPGVLDGQVVWNPHSRRTTTKTIGSSSGGTAHHVRINGWGDVETDGITFAASTWTIQSPGYYYMRHTGIWEADPTGRRRLRILLNGSLLDVLRILADPDDVTYMSLITQARLNTGDQITAWAEQNSGHGLSLATTFDIYRISI